MLKKTPAALLLSFAVLISLPVDTLLAAEPPGCRVDVEDRGDALVLRLETPESTVARFRSGDDPLSRAFTRGEGVTLANGKPSLPAVTRWVVLPPRAGVALDVTAAGTRRLPASGLPFSYDADGRPHPADLAPGELYPPQTAVISRPVILRGVRLAAVTLHPVQYDATSGEYVLHPELTATVRFTDAPPVNPVVYENRSNRSRMLPGVLKLLGLDPDYLLRDQDMERNYTGHYLVVAREECITDAIPLIEWKRRSGYKVDILSYPGEVANSDDGPATIKEDIQALYDGYLEDGVDPFDYILILGDRRGNIGDASWVLQSFLGTPSVPVANHADYIYALLEGDDEIPDVGIGRFASGSEAMMQLAVARTLSYEAHPWDEDTAWYTRGGAYNEAWGEDFSVEVPFSVAWGEEVLQRLGFDEVRLIRQFNPNEGGFGDSLLTWFNGQVGLMVGRSENWDWRDGIEGLENNTVFPVQLNIGGHGEFALQNIFRSGDADNLKGVVAATTGWGDPRTLPNSVVWYTLVRAVLNYDLPLGWGRSLACALLPVYLDTGDEEQNLRLLQQYQTETDLYGDPGLQPWTGVPRTVSSEHPERIAPDAGLFEVRVTDAGGNAVGGAQVTLYAPGDIPDPEEYPDWQPALMLVRWTGGDGSAVFNLEGELPEGNLFVTVTGRDIRPVLDTVAVAVPDVNVVLENYTLGGNGYVIRAGQQRQLSLTAANTGSRDTAEDVTAIVRCDLPFIEIATDTVRFDDIPAGESAAGDRSIALTAAEDSPYHPNLPFVVEFHSAGVAWRSLLHLDLIAPDMEVAAATPAVLPLGEAQSLSLGLTNTGGNGSDPLSVRLVALDGAVTVLDNEGEYPAVNSGDTVYTDPENDFIVRAESQAIPGYLAPMLLLVEADDGWRDTVAFKLQVGEPAENSPQGPDDYGYVCLDDTDRDWDLAPQYNWTEISRRDGSADFAGTLLEDLEEQNDNSQVLDLPFEFRFYGNVYDQLTVCTNGFIAVGAQPRVVSYQNFPLEEGFGGAAGMLAPFWDNLTPNENLNGSVWYYHDEETGTFIVEWWNYRHNSDGQSRYRFEVIIYDAAEHPTATGDCRILFQYYEVSAVEGPAGEMPYSSVGISSPDGGTGIGYAYGGEYPVTSAPLARRRAVLFTPLYDIIASVPGDSPHQLQRYALLPNYPNPFNAATTIPFLLPTQAEVSLRLFDLTGRQVAVLTSGTYPAGRHQVHLVASTLPEGIYICRLDTPNFTESQPIMLLK